MKTNEQIIQEREQAIAEMTPEMREAYLAAEVANDRLIAMKLSEQYGVSIEVIPGDLHHIKVDGVVMGYNEFAEWQAAQMPEEDEEEAEEDRHYGLFSA